jgi:hypothetical protein
MWMTGLKKYWVTEITKSTHNIGFSQMASFQHIQIAPFANQHQFQSPFVKKAYVPILIFCNFNQQQLRAEDFQNRQIAKP